MTKPLAPRFLTTLEVARALRVSKMTVTREIHAGHIRAVRVGQQFRIPESALDEYVRVFTVGFGDGWGEE